MNVERILAPVDFSECSRRAVQAAQDLARDFGAELHVLHSYRAEPPVMAPYAPAIPPGYLDEIRGAAERHLHQWTTEVCRSDVEPIEHLSMSPPWEAIVGVAEEISASLIVIGTRGLTGLKHVLLGSVAEKTVRSAPCPVLTWKAR